jgi:hypothetical protein
VSVSRQSLPTVGYTGVPSFSAIATLLFGRSAFLYMTTLSPYFWITPFLSNVPGHIHVNPFPKTASQYTPGHVSLVCPAHGSSGLSIHLYVKSGASHAAILPAGQDDGLLESSHCFRHIHWKPPGPPVSGPHAAEEPESHLSSGGALPLHFLSGHSHAPVEGSHEASPTPHMGLSSGGHAPPEVFSTQAHWYPVSRVHRFSCPGGQSYEGLSGHTPFVALENAMYVVATIAMRTRGIVNFIYALHGKRYEPCYDHCGYPDDQRPREFRRYVLLCTVTPGAELVLFTIFNTGARKATWTW